MDPPFPPLDPCMIMLNRFKSRATAPFPMNCVSSTIKTQCFNKDVARTLKMLCTSKGDYWNKQ